MPLSPHTPPGTHIVVTWVERNAKEVLDLIHPSHREFAREHYHKWYSPNGIKLGNKFTLHSIVPCDLMADGFHCHLNEIGGCYSLKHFDVAQLPKSITDLLVSKPMDEVV